MKKAKKVIAVILAMVMVGLTFIIPVCAAERIDPNDGAGAKAKIFFYRLVDKLIVVVGKVLNLMIPGLDWTTKWSFAECSESTGLMPGASEFDDSTKDGAQWAMGYASASLLDGIDVMSGEYYMAGSLSVNGRTPSKLLDDQRVCAYALTDGANGIAVQAVIDGYGIARGDVIEIRNRLSDFSKEYNIVSINVSVMHQHSCIDTLGLGAPLAAALLKNPAKAITGQSTDNFVKGTNTTFMENMFEKTVDCIEEAVETMTEGSLYYGSGDIGEYMYDKRDPQVYDTNINRLRFVPEDESYNEIWVCQLSVHCVNLGASTDILSGDYPYYFRNYIKEQTGADVVMTEGAELAITTDYTNVQSESEDDAVKLEAYAKAIGDITISIDNDIELSPVMNVAFREVSIQATNEVLVLACRQGLINNVIEKNIIGNLSVVTEIGYMELGNEVGIICMPGELAPEIVFGGAQSADKSWTGESWDYAPMAETAGVEHIMVYGLCNDQIGYVITDNDVRSMLTENEEIVASSTKSASILTEAFEALIAEVK